MNAWSASRAEAPPGTRTEGAAMLARILALSIEHRGTVIVAVLALAAFGAYCLTILPIDAVPDVTNVQVQINTIDSALSPVEMERQVTFVP
jgi:cobalt-zinc-cadmium resistance protein CzcA